MHEVVFRQPAEALLVGEQVGQGRGHRTLRQQRTQRFALVNPERGDVDEAGDVGRVGPQGGHDLAAVGVAGHDRRAILEVQHLAQPGDVIGYRGHRELRCRDVVATGLQALDDRAPARTISPRAVDENDIGSCSHVSGSFLVTAVRPWC